MIFDDDERILINRRLVTLLIKVPNTHTYIQIHTYICICVCVYIWRNRKLVWQTFTINSARMYINAHSIIFFQP